MPCLAKNPSQTQKTRDGHKHSEIYVLQDTYSDVPTPSNTIMSEHLMNVGQRILIEPVDFNNGNITEEELKARLAAFDVIREAHSQTLLKYRSGGHRMKLGLNLTEALLDCDELNKYKVPLCYREIDDDLEVTYNEAENALD